MIRSCVCSHRRNEIQFLFLFSNHKFTNKIFMYEKSEKRENMYTKYSIKTLTIKIKLIFLSQ